MDKIIEGYKRRIEELEGELSVAQAENFALHQLIREFRDDLTAKDVQLNLMVRDRTYVV
jgi:hypothetical protein